jgi:hypothetical protein
MIADLFSGGRAADAASHRLFQCTHASDCRKLCERMVKEPGVAGVFCVDITTSPIQKIALYPVLEDPDFSCPRGRF